MRRLSLACASAAALLSYVLWCVSALAAPQTLAVFDFQLIDTSLSGQMRGPNPAEDKRLAAITDQLRKLVQNSGKFRVVDIAPIEDEAKRANLSSCNGCDATLAKKAGADLSLVGTVQKVSELILNVNLYVRDTASGRIVGVMSADMRGNTDESWRHTISWLVRNRLTQPDFGERK